MPATDPSVSPRLTRCNAGRTIYDHSASLDEGERHYGQGVDNPAGAGRRADVVTDYSTIDSRLGVVAPSVRVRALDVALPDVARPDGREGVPVDVLAHPPVQPPGTSAGSTSPIRRQPFDSSHVRGAATSGGRSASA